MQQIQHHDIAVGSKNYADLMANLTQSWNDTAKNADPNDAGAAQKWRETVMEPALDKFANEGFLTEGGQQFAQQHVAALRDHLVQKTSADMSTLAGVAAHTNFIQTTNKLASTVFSDPSALDFALKTADSALGAIVSSSPNLSAADAARVRSTELLAAREGIVKSAVVGMIEKNPNIDLAAIEQKYGEYLKPGEMAIFQKAAKAQAKTNLLTDRQLAITARQQADQQVHAGMNKIMTDNITIDPATNRPIINPAFFKQSLDLARNNPDAPSASTAARTLLDWGEHQQNLKDNVPTDQVTKQGLVDGMFSADRPTSDIDIMRAEVGGKLSRSDAASMLALNKMLTDEPLRGPIWHDTMDAAKAQLVTSIPGLPGHDTVGAGNYAKFVQTFIPQYISAKSAGTLAPNALDVNDPKSMISQAMAPFKRSPAQRIQDYTAALGGVSNAVEVAPSTATLPAKDERKVGQTYPTAMGPMKWTGAAWVKP